MVELRALDPSDGEAARALHGLRQRAYTQEAELLGVAPASFPPLQQQLWELQSGNESHLGAFQDRQLVGAISWAADDDDAAAQWITALVVDPAQQRQGVATLLLHALDHLNGGAPLTVQTATANAPAMALYQGFGFRPLQRWAGSAGLGLVKLRRDGNLNKR